MMDMQGQIAVVFGVANKRSIAYSIAESLAGAGATLVLCYQSERLRKDSEQLLSELGQSDKGRLIQCDVTSDDQIAAADLAGNVPGFLRGVGDLAGAGGDAVFLK